MSAVKDKPKALVVYFSYTQTTAQVAGRGWEVARGEGYEVSSAPLEFTDPHYSKIFSKPVPMSSPALKYPRC